MIKNKFKSFFTLLLIVTFIMPQTLLAYSEYIVASGDNIGLQINNDGIIIAGFYNIDDKYPGKEAGLQKGDTIVKANNIKINSIDDFISVIEKSNQRNINLVYKRNNIEYKTVLNLLVEKETIKTGLYVKDMVSGLGTLTFIDPKTKLYGALGHEVIESSSGQKVDVKEGKIYNSTVTSIDKSIRGEPGSKNASVDSNDVYGNIIENTTSGVFGKYTKDINTDNLYKVATLNDIKKGNAKIITVIDGNEKKEYDINILKIIGDNQDNKNIFFEITDKELIDKTGGIVQGMSGSPIIQGEYIIGAVTNVVVNNPTRGYAILITSMLEEAEN